MDQVVLTYLADTLLFSHYDIWYLKERQTLIYFINPGESSGFMSKYLVMHFFNSKPSTGGDLILGFPRNNIKTPIKSDWRGMWECHEAESTCFNPEPGVLYPLCWARSGKLNNGSNKSFNPPSTSPISLWNKTAEWCSQKKVLLWYLKVRQSTWKNGPIFWSFISDLICTDSDTTWRKRIQKTSRVKLGLKFPP